MRIYDGPTEVHKWVVARNLLGTETMKGTGSSLSDTAMYRSRWTGTSPAVDHLHRPPHNSCQRRAACATWPMRWRRWTASRRCRAIVLAAEGKSFCAGADLATPATRGIGLRCGEHQRRSTSRRCGCSRCRSRSSRRFRARRSARAWAWRWSPTSGSPSPEARFAANFVKLGFHPGFGLTHTLPRLIGEQRASLMFLTGRRIKAEEALPGGWWMSSRCRISSARRRAAWPTRSPRTRRWRCIDPRDLASGSRRSGQGADRPRIRRAVLAGEDRGFR